jgi:uroporphyrinogen-III synthase
MPQNKITILSTNEIDQAFITEAAERNITVEVSPFIKTEPIRSIETQQEIELALLESITVVFTSVNAVEAVATELLDLQADWKIYCIGYSTKQAVEKYFGKDSVAGVADNAKTLAELIIKETETDEVFFFCGNQRRTELGDALRKNGIETTEIVVYQTVLLPHKIQKDYNGILFFSPSSVTAFFQKNTLNAQTVLFAIGDTTATEIKKFLPCPPDGQAGSNNKIILSDEPLKKSLLAKAIDFFERVHH